MSDQQPQIIAFTGKKLSGKTSAAKFFKDKGFICHNFKDALIDDLKLYFPDLLNDFAVHYGLDLNQLFSQKPDFVRHLLQNFGTNYVRDRFEDHWVLAWVDKAIDLKRDNQLIVTDDCRFLNEAECVRSLGGKIVRIVRPSLKSNDKHLTETEMDKIISDYEIIADDMPTLIAKCEDLYNKLFLK